MKYKSGILVALLDEYEKALNEYVEVISQLGCEEKFCKIVDTQTKDEDCRSVQTIARHVIDSGYYYAEFIRKRLNLDLGNVPKKESFAATTFNCIQEMGEMFIYTEDTFKDRMDMNDQQLESAVMKTSWGTIYDIEQLMEHAIVHILRHRRQIERFRVSALE